MNLVQRIKNYLLKPDSTGELAEEARFLLNHPVMLQAFERLENDILMEFLNSQPNDIEVREDLYSQLRAFNALKSRLEGFIHLSLINRSNIHE